MDWTEVVAGVLLIAYPFIYSRQMRNIHRKIAARDGDVDKFRRHMDRPWIRASMWLLPVLGAVVVVVGLTS